MIENQLWKKCQLERDKILIGKSDKANFGQNIFDHFFALKYSNQETINNFTYKGNNFSNNKYAGGIRASENWEILDLNFNNGHWIK